MDRYPGTGNQSAGETVTPAFFIVGVGRSGTTLLQAMLNAHPRIGVSPEFHFVRRFLFTNTLRTTGDGMAQARFLQADRFIRRLNIPEAKWQKWAQQVPEGDSRLYWFTRILSDVHSRTGKPIIGVKEPRAIEWLVPLSRLFPQSKILHIVRDPRDVLLSKLRAGWSRNRPPALHVAVHKYQLAMWHYAESHSLPMLTIHYENLIRESETVLREVCRFLGVEYSPAMLTYYTSADKLIHKDEAEWKGNVTRPVLKNNAGKWRQELPKSYQYLMQSVLKEDFKTLGMPLEPVALSIGQRVRWWMVAQAVRAGAWGLTRYQQWKCNRILHTADS